MPQLHMWGRGYAKNSHAPAVGAISLPMCDSCAAKVELDDLLSDEGRRMLTDTFVAGMKCPPSWETCELRFQPLGEAVFNG